jgi:hypothetical protein
MSDNVRVMDWAAWHAASALCRPGATVIWTRGRRPPDLTPQVRAWFSENGFGEVAFDAGWPDGRLFTFRGRD